jgi:hypothetical protein
MLQSFFKEKQYLGKFRNGNKNIRGKKGAELLHKVCFDIELSCTGDVTPTKTTFEDQAIFCSHGS